MLLFSWGKVHEYIDGDEVVGLGSINKEGSGRLRLVASQPKVGFCLALFASVDAAACICRCSC
jgi:hypothetical protein